MTKPRKQQRGRKRLILVAVLAFAIGAVAAFPGQTEAATLYGTNLIVNGDAESSPGDADGFAPFTDTLTGSWSTSVGRSPHVVVYDAVSPGTGFPRSTDPGPPDRGANFFTGGFESLAHASQFIDVSAIASEIDEGLVTFILRGFLGGFATQADHAQLNAIFLDGPNQLNVVTIGPVTETDRSNRTRLLPRTTSGAVPIGTRTIHVLLVMNRFGGSSNDGYADNLSLAARPRII